MLRSRCFGSGFTIAAEVCLPPQVDACKFNGSDMPCVCFFFSSFSISCQNSGFQLNIQKIISVANRFSLMVMGNVLK